MTHEQESQALGLGPLDGEAGPALELSPAESRALVARILERGRTTGASAELRPPRLWRWLLAAAVIAIVSGAVAAGSLIVAPPSRSRDQSPSSTPAPPPSTPTRAQRGVGTGQPKTLPSDAEPIPPASAAASESGPPVAAFAPPAAGSSSAARSAPASADLLLVANQLRRVGRWQDADAAYARVVELHPNSQQAYVATLASASLHLDHLGDPAGALSRYRLVLHRGPLAEEALYGAARCHRALGDRDAEARALQALLTRYPNSLRRAQAEQRLNELQGESKFP